MSKSLKSYIDDQKAPRRPKGKLFQGTIDPELLDQVISQRRRDKLSWRDLLEPLFRMYLDQAAERDQAPQRRKKAA